MSAPCSLDSALAAALAAAGSPSALAAQPLSAAGSAGKRKADCLEGSLKRAKLVGRQGRFPHAFLAPASCPACSCHYSAPTCLCRRAARSAQRRLASPKPWRRQGPAPTRASRRYSQQPLHHPLQQTRSPPAPHCRRCSCRPRPPPCCPPWAPPQRPARRRRPCRPPCLRPRRPCPLPRRCGPSRARPPPIAARRPVRLATWSRWGGGCQLPRWEWPGQAVLCTTQNASPHALHCRWPACRCRAQEARRAELLQQIVFHAPALRCVAGYQLASKSIGDGGLGCVYEAIHLGASWALPLRSCCAAPLPLLLSSGSTPPCWPPATGAGAGSCR